jgi:TorA maturation chaperone TorD
MNAATQASVAARRSAVYWLLAEFLLVCPSRAQVERLREDLAGSDAAEADADPLAAGLAAVRDALPEHTDAAAIDQLAVEYTRLFGAISPNYGLAPPYESVQRKTAAAAELAVAISASYSDAGFEAIDSSVPPDHLGVELRFMALLCHDEMQQWQSNDAEKAVQSLGRQRDFLDDHLLQWAPGYLRLVQMQAGHAFFRNVAALGVDVIPADRAMFEEILADLDAA